MRNRITIPFSAFSLAALLFSCQSEEKYQTNFQLIDTSSLPELVGKGISTIDSSCYYDGIVTDSMLLLTDACNDFFLYGFEKEQFRTMVESGRTGQGPGDFISLPFFSYENDEMGIAIWDPSGFFKEAELNGTDLTFSESKNLNTEFRGNKKVIRSGDKVYSSKTRSTKGVVFYNQEDEEGVHWIAMPDFIETHVRDFISEDRLVLPLVDNNFEVGETDQFLAVGMKYFNTIFFINNDGRVLRSFLLGTQDEQDKLIAPEAVPEDEIMSEENAIFVYDSYATDRFLYFLSYGGSSLYNFQNNFDYRTPDLLIFDRKMNYVKGLSMDRMLGFICVSPDDKSLFAGAVESDGITTIVEYELDL